MSVKGASPSIRRALTFIVRPMETESPMSMAKFAAQTATVRTSAPIIPMEDTVLSVRITSRRDVSSSDFMLHHSSRVIGSAWIATARSQSERGARTAQRQKRADFRTRWDEARRARARTSESPQNVRAAQIVPMIVITRSAPESENGGEGLEIDAARIKATMTAPIAKATEKIAASGAVRETWAGWTLPAGSSIGRVRRSSAAQPIQAINGPPASSRAPTVASPSPPERAGESRTNAMIVV